MVKNPLGVIRIPSGVGEFGQNSFRNGQDW